MELSSNFIDYEMNEFMFWLKWVESSYSDDEMLAISSNYFNENFFNRAFVISCKNLDRTIKKAEEFFKTKKGYSVCIPENCSYTPEGYFLEDEMLVMQKQRETRKVRGATVYQGDLEEWCRTYLLSFYESTDLLEGTLSSVSKLIKEGRTTLIGYVRDSILVGVTALYETESTIGAYCVGTVKKYRKAGIGSSMLSLASEIAEERKKRLILQTLKSDGLESFYAKNGFVIAYRKKIFSRVR